MSVRMLCSITVTSCCFFAGCAATTLNISPTSNADAVKVTISHAMWPAPPAIVVDHGEAYDGETLAARAFVCLPNGNALIADKDQERTAAKTAKQDVSVLNPDEAVAELDTSRVNIAQFVKRKLGIEMAEGVLVVPQTRYPELLTALAHQDISERQLYARYCRSAAFGVFVGNFGADSLSWQRKPGKLKISEMRHTDPKIARLDSPMLIAESGHAYEFMSYDRGIRASGISLGSSDSLIYGPADFQYPGKIAVIGAARILRPPMDNHTQNISLSESMQAANDLTANIKHVLEGKGYQVVYAQAAGIAFDSPGFIDRAIYEDLSSQVDNVKQRVTHHSAIKYLAEYDTDEELKSVATRLFTNLNAVLDTNESDLVAPVPGDLTTLARHTASDTICVVKLDGAKYSKGQKLMYLAADAAALTLTCFEAASQRLVWWQSFYETDVNPIALSYGDYQKILNYFPQQSQASFTACRYETDLRAHVCPRLYLNPAPYQEQNMW